LADDTDAFDHGKRDRRKGAAEPPARYFFHLVKGPTRIDDRVGVELHQDALTSPYVMTVVREIWPGTVDQGAFAGWSVQIVDRHGNVVRLLRL
jgi:hypothetical protein